jgi:hypothetical protein
MKIKDLFEFDDANNGDHKWEPLPMQIEEALIRDCQPYLKEARSLHGDERQFWRGISSNDISEKTLVDVIHARLDHREAFSTPSDVHHMLNRWFEKKFGWKARNGVFAVGNLSEANFYGTPHAIFPIGEFKYVWSPNVYDLYGDLELHLFSKEHPDGQPDVYTEKVLDENISYFKWLDTDLQEALGKNREVMFKCDTYIAIKREKLDELDWDFIFSSLDL